MTLTRGATRSDGYRFLSYERRGGKLREKWRSPEAYARAILAQKNAMKTRPSRRKLPC